MPSAARNFLAIVSLVLVLLMVTSQGSAHTAYFDDFPSALSHYVTGGWRGPFGDGTGGTIAPTGDGMGILLDGTVNALAYAIRRSPSAIDANLTVSFAIRDRDMTEADQFSLLLAWRNSTYPDQSSCPPCSSPTPESGIVFNLNIGRGTVRVSEVTNYVATEVAVAASGLTAGPTHEARVEYVNRNLSIYLDGVRELVVSNIDKPEGAIGFMTYRMDVAVDSLTFEVPRETPSGAVSTLPSSIWLDGLLAGMAGGVIVTSASLAAGWLWRRRKRL